MICEGSRFHFVGKQRKADYRRNIFIIFILLTILELEI